jgi:hypothetical protein
MRQVDGREFHGWAPMRESLEDRVRRVELDEQRRFTALGGGVHHLRMPGVRGGCRDHRDARAGQLISLLAQ